MFLSSLSLPYLSSISMYLSILPRIACLHVLYFVRGEKVLCIPQDWIELGVIFSCNMRDVFSISYSVFGFSYFVFSILYSGAQAFGYSLN